MKTGRQSSKLLSAAVGCAHVGVLVAALAIGLTASAAEQPKAKAAPARPAATKPWEAAPERPMKEFMAHVISYSAFNVWNWQGWVTDKNGTRALFPKNDEEWEAAESAAQTLDEVTGLLQLPNRRVNVAGWDEAALLVRKLARQSAEAAAKHDEDAFFKLGTDLQEACEECHIAVGLVKPQPGNEPAASTPPAKTPAAKTPPKIIGGGSAAPKGAAMRLR